MSSRSEVLVSWLAESDCMFVVLSLELGLSQLRTLVVSATDRSHSVVTVHLVHTERGVRGRQRDGVLNVHRKDHSLDGHGVFVVHIFQEPFVVDVSGVVLVHVLPCQDLEAHVGDVQPKFGQSSGELLVGHVLDIDAVEILERWLHQDPPCSDFSAQVVQNGVEKGLFLVVVQTLRFDIQQVRFCSRHIVKLLLNTVAEGYVVDQIGVWDPVLVDQGGDLFLHQVEFELRKPRP